MMKLLVAAVLFFTSTNTAQTDIYSWKEASSKIPRAVHDIQTPSEFTRLSVVPNSYQSWLRNLPLKPKGSVVKLWNGEQKYRQDIHVSVVDLDFIGQNLQQCVDAIIRLRSEYLWSTKRVKGLGFTYTCCSDPVTWDKWREGWRTKIFQEKGRWKYSWVHSKKPDNSYQNFRKYLFNIMMYAGTQSLSRDMQKINANDVQIGDAYVQGGAPGYGHGVLILDMAQSASGEKIMLLGQSYNPAEEFNILKSDDDVSPWFRVDFGEELVTPQWTFLKEHARRFAPE